MLIVMIFLAGTSCKNKGEVPDVPVPDSASAKGANLDGLDIDPALGTADSLQVLYYDDPDGDSLRYSRYFTYHNTADTMLIRTLREALHQPFDFRSAVKPCRSEGKIYMLAGEQPLRTVYFSTRCDSCCHFYFIKDGNFYYFPLTPALKSSLAETRKKAGK